MGALYLYYILVEILKNSSHATIRRMQRASSISADDTLPIQVTISISAERVAIRISDRAGGIPFEVGERIWAFGYSGSSQEGPSSLAGYGLGLPMSRLYARFLGGDIRLISLPEYGADTFLSLRRIDIDSELPQQEHWM